MEKLKVFLIEDQEDIRQGYEFLINQSSEFQCTGFVNAEKAIEQIDLNRMPHVILMDVNLPGMNGIAATQLLKAKYPRLLIMMFTVYENNENVFDALAAGASGYLLKQNTPSQLLEAIRDLCNGGSPMSSQIARKVVLSFQKKNIAGADETELTDREKEVLQHIAAGYRNKEIAQMLSISISTIKSHIYSIYQKLHVTSRVQMLNKISARN
jgi:DNA-binding NarL/FixJ family response regulator